MNKRELDKMKSEVQIWANLLTMLSLGLLGWEPRIFMKDISNEDVIVLTKYPAARIELTRILLWNLPKKIN